MEFKFAGMFLFLSNKCVVLRFKKVILNEVVSTFPFSRFPLFSGTWSLTQLAMSNY